MTSGEDSLIARYFRPLATDPGAFGLGDDAAVLSALGDDIVVTTDAIVEGVHFLSADPPDTIARKALRVNLSDLAAKGMAVLVISSEPDELPDLCDRVLVMAEGRIVRELNGGALSRSAIIEASYAGAAAATERLQ